MESKSSPLVEELLALVPHASSLYHQLVLLVMPTPRDVHIVLKQAQAQTSWPLLNLSLELGSCLQGVPAPRRPLRVKRCLDAMIENSEGEVVLLDRLALLFHPSLQQNPLELLKQLARDRTLLAGWAGQVQDRVLTYAETNHPEYGRFDTADLLLVHAAAPH